MMPTYVAKLHKVFKILVNGYWRRVFFAHRVAASVEHIDVIRSILSLNTVVDIGANRGQFALLVTKYFPRVKVLAFEPLELPSQIFLRIFKSSNNVRLFNVAIGSSSKHCLMHISGRDDSSSLLPISQLQADIFPGTEECATAYVTMAPLSTFLVASDILAPALLKLDVQGYEFEALCGCDSLIEGFEFIYCECSFLELYQGQKKVTDILVWLFERGYCLHGIYNTSYNSSGIAVQSDFLFKKSW